MQPLEPTKPHEHSHVLRGQQRKKVSSSPQATTLIAVMLSTLKCFAAVKVWSCKETGQIVKRFVQVAERKTFFNMQEKKNKEKKKP